jgi:hypothetical protein
MCLHRNSVRGRLVATVQKGLTPEGVSYSTARPHLGKARARPVLSDIHVLATYFIVNVYG